MRNARSPGMSSTGIVYLQVATVKDSSQLCYEKDVRTANRSAIERAIIFKPIFREIHAVRGAKLDRSTSIGQVRSQ